MEDPGGPVSEADLRAFFYRVFGQPEARRHLLMQWHAMRKKEERPRLADVFEDFLKLILYAPLVFRMHSDRFYMMGDQLPIRYEWLGRANRDMIVRMFAERVALFRNRREFENGQFDYSLLSVAPESQLFEPHWRRQIARDFVWMVSKRAQPFATLELIAALQGIMIARPGDVFVATLHGALQGRCVLNRVPCWGLVPWD